MIPESWTRSTIGELCEMVKGAAPIMKTLPGPYPLVTTGEDRRTADRYQFDGEAVCVPMISSAGHGVASLKRVHYQTGKFAVANLLTALLVRDPSKLLPRFLALYLNRFKDRFIVPLMVGAANMGLTMQRLSGVPVCFPPTERQGRILEVLSELERIHQLQASASERLGELASSIFDSLMKLGVGRHWRSATLGDVSQIQGGLQLCGKRESYLMKRPYLRVANVQRGSLLLSEVKRIGLTPEEFCKTRLSPGDLLLVEGNGSPNEIGRAAMWDGSIADCVHQNHIIRVRCNPDMVVPGFVLAFVNHHAGRNYFLRAGRTTSGLVTISTGLVKKLPVLLPPLSLQAEVSNEIMEAQGIEDRLVYCRRKLDTLREGLMTRAFRGEL